MAAAGTNYTVLLRSDGSAVSCGDNQYEQGTIPALAARRGLFRLAIPSFSLFFPWRSTYNHLRIASVIGYSHLTIDSKRPS